MTDRTGLSRRGMYGQTGGAMEARDLVDETRRSVSAYTRTAAVRSHREHVRSAA